MWRRTNRSTKGHSSSSTINYINGLYNFNLLRVRLSALAINTWCRRPKSGDSLKVKTEYLDSSWRQGNDLQSYNCFTWICAYPSSNPKAKKHGKNQGVQRSGKQNSHIIPVFSRIYTADFADSAILIES